MVRNAIDQLRMILQPSGVQPRADRQRRRGVLQVGRIAGDAQALADRRQVLIAEAVRGQRLESTANCRRHRRPSADTQDQQLTGVCDHPVPFCLCPTSTTCNPRYTLLRIRQVFHHDVLMGA